MIISFSKLGNHGRLGNQLFQVASTLGMAEKYGAQAAFPEWSYEQYFETPIPHGNMETKLVTEKYFHHHDWELTESCDILGYLQSEKYFGSCSLKLKENFVEAQKAKFPRLFEKETICIHIRRGDFIGNDQYAHLPITYYIRALQDHFANWKEVNILFLSDDIEYCRTHFECLPNAFFSSGLSDIEDMALGSACDHFIISNSTFGWWVAWFGEKKSKHTKVIRPVQQFAGKLAAQNKVTDYAPERWIAYDRTDWKLNLKDITFTIPVFYDHLDRRQNLELCLYMIQSAFETNFIICEQGGNRFEYTKQWAKYVRTDASAFHRTKMLNDMCTQAETPFVANWDCDVIVPPMQLLMAVEELRAGAEMVFPYDGRFARMPRSWFVQIQRHKDIGIVGGTAFRGREADHNSVGGAVLWNKEAFIDGGMENEHFISFGPEDCERHDRFKLLGFDIRRVQGTLFHIDHFVGVNSSNRNPHFKANYAELDKIRAMNADELRQYVDTWAWRHPYTSRYRSRISEGSIASAKIVMEALRARCGVSDTSSVIDIGCGLGEWSNGNPNYVGVDNRVDRSKLLIAAENFIECNLERDFVTSEKKYDLCLCLEVAEHIRPERAAGLVKMLCDLSDRVLFSAAVPYQGGTGHVNEQWQSWWAELFMENGFGAAKKQPNIKDDARVEYWYRNNIVLYERGAKGTVQDGILPEYYMQIVGHLHALQKVEVMG